MLEIEIERILETGIIENELEEEMVTYYLIGSAFGWSPKDIEDLEYEKVRILRIFAVKKIEEDRKFLMELICSIFDSISGN